jgi:hypothetical protein
MRSLRSFVCGAIGIVFAACDSTSPASSLELGGWGGEHVGLFVESTSVSFLFDCAGGSVSQPIPLAADGSFDVTGTYSNGGNAFGVDHTPHATRYFGRVTGTHISFTRILLDGSLPDATFTADFGVPPGIVAC